MPGKDLARRSLIAALAAALGVGLPSHVAAQSLRGSSSSLDVQNRMAHDHDFTYLATATQVKRFVNAGYLVPVRPNGDFDLHAVSFPYARPEAEVFVRRLAAQYRAACGEKLVVTSLTRPQSRQPRNASDRSVHPTGMAIDLRRSNSARCRGWLEDVLLGLEKSGILEATRERYPPHYHIALFPEPYARYVARLASSGAPSGRKAAPAQARPATRTASAAIVRYEVRPGDSLWGIARRLGTTVDELRSENELRGNRIFAGQVIQVPAAR